MDYDELGLSEGSDEPAAKPKKKAEGKKKAPAGGGAGGYDPFGKPTVYGGSSNLGLVPETYLKDTEGMKLEEIEGVAN